MLLGFREVSGHHFVQLDLEQPDELALGFAKVTQQDLRLGGPEVAAVGTHNGFVAPVNHLIHTRALPGQLHA